MIRYRLIKKSSGVVYVNGSRADVMHAVRLLANTGNDKHFEVEKWNDKKGWTIVKR